MLQVDSPTRSGEVCVWNSHLDTDDLSEHYTITRYFFLCAAAAPTRPGRAVGLGKCVERGLTG